LRRLLSFVRTIAVLVASLAATSGASAQDSAQTGIIEEDGATIYLPTFFEPYRPSHAKDMLERVPGAAGALSTGAANNAGDEDRRGLRSQTTQVLINGKRLTTKGNSINDYFERIPSDQVERIEVIVGNVREIDADVGQRVINVVLADTGGIGGTFSVGNVSFTDGRHMPTLSGSVSGETGPWSYTLSGETRPRQLPRLQRELLRDSNDDLFLEQEERRRMKSRRYIGRGRLAYAPGPNSQAQLSGFIEDRPIGEQNDTEFDFLIAPDGTRTADGGSLRFLTGEDLEYEISGDYSAPLSKSVAFKGLFVYSVDDENRNNENFSFALNPDNAQLTSGDTRDERATEKILRGTFDWAFAPKHSLEIGAEGAVNELDKTQSFFDVVNGQRVDREVFNADQVVTEDRLETFGSHTWRPTDRWEIETGIAAEFSWLDQLGSDIDTRRTFQFAKPSLDVYFTQSEQTQIYASVRRDIGQLEFEDFIADLDRDDGEIDAGNPDLAPEKSWDLEIGTEHRLANDAGVINLRGFYRDVSDVSDNVPFGVNDSAPGNLGSGRHYGAELETSLQLQKLGLIDAVISGTFLWQDSSVEDPFTGERRRFADQERYEINIDARHDLSKWAMNYGFVMTVKGPKIRSDFETFERERAATDLRIFLERRFENGIVGRLFWGNALRGKTKRTRIVYATSQAAGDVLRTELRTQKQGGFYGFSVRGTF
jgi:outer membrane receptor for ferrienterochelin and colicins